MGGDVQSLAAEMMPYASAAVAAYGGAVLAKVRDDAADATVGLGRRLLQRVFGSRGDDGWPCQSDLAPPTALIWPHPRLRGPGVAVKVLL
jgi:hypothetical protein